MRTTDLIPALDRLLAEFGSRLPAGSVVKAFAASVHDLRVVGVHAGLPVAAETMTRHRLNRRLAAGTQAA